MSKCFKKVKLGKGAFMAKTDIKSAFCLLPVHPDSVRLLGGGVFCGQVPTNGLLHFLYLF